MIAPIVADIATATQMLIDGDWHRAEQYARAAVESAAELSFDPDHRATALDLLANADTILRKATA